MGRTERLAGRIDDPNRSARQGVSTPDHLLRHRPGSFPLEGRRLERRREDLAPRSDPYRGDAGRAGGAGLGGFPLERLNPSIQVAVGPAKQAFHFTDLLANLLANRHEFLRELLIQAGDPFRDEADVRAQTFSHDVEMAFEIIKSSIALLVHDADLAPQPFSHDNEMAFEIIESSIRFVESPIRFVESSIRFLESPIRFLVHDADLAPQPFGHDVEMAFDVVGCLAIHRSSCLPRLAPRLISIVAAFRSTKT
jgi:hypothetical protein